jgi:uncharacterized protein with PhoU and TrkA domain
MRLSNQQISLIIGALRLLEEGIEYEWDMDDIAKVVTDDGVHPVPTPTDINNLICLLQFNEENDRVTMAAAPEVPDSTYDLFEPYV